MNILIALKKDDCVYMGTDTRCILNDYVFNDTFEHSYRIQSLDNGIVVGITADRRTEQIVLANSDIFTLDKNGKLTKKHIVKKIIPRYIELLAKHDLIVKSGKDALWVRAEVLIAYKDVLFEICPSLFVIRHEEFVVLGHTRAFAVSPLMNANKTDVPNDTIINALKSVSKNSHNVGAPYLLMDTKEQNYTLVKGGN